MCCIIIVLCSLYAIPRKVFCKIQGIDMVRIRVLGYFQCCVDALNLGSKVLPKFRKNFSIILMLSHASLATKIGEKSSKITNQACVIVATLIKLYNG